MRQPPSAPRIVLQFDSSSFGLRAPSLQELTQAFSTYSIEEVLPVMARLCCLVSLGQSDKDVQQWAATGLLSPVLRASCDESTTKEPWVFLTRRLLLAAIHIFSCFGSLESGSKTLVDSTDRWRFGELLLGLSSLIGAVESDGAETGEEVGTVQDVHPFKKPNKIMASLLRTGLLDCEPRHGLELSRGYTLLFEEIPRAYGTQKQSFDGLLSQVWRKLGCDPQDLWFLAMGTFMMNSAFGIEDFSKIQPGLKRDEFFANFNWTSERIDRTLDVLSISVDSLRRRASVDMDLRNTSRFADTPILRIGDRHVLVDPVALSTFLGDRIFKRISDCLDQAARVTFNSCFGLAFQAYAISLAEHAIRFGKATSKMLAIPKDQKGYDLLIEDGRVMSALEVKTDFISNEAIFSDDTQRFANEIRASSFVTAVPRQLVSASKQLLSRERQPVRIHLGLIQWSDAFAFFCVQSELNERFIEQLQKMQVDLSSVMFKRPLVFSKHEWEQVCVIVATGRSFVDCFDAIISQDPIGESPAGFSLGWKGYSTGTMPASFISERLSGLRTEAQKHLVNTSLD